MSQNNEILVNMKVRKILWEIKFVELLFVIDCSSGLQDGRCVQSGLKAIYAPAQSNSLSFSPEEKLDHCLPIEHLSKTHIRLRKCAV